MTQQATFLVAIIDMEDGTIVPLAMAGSPEEGAQICADTQDGRGPGEITALIPLTVLHQVPY